MLRHWVRAGVEYPDYPYARFDVHLEKLSYNDTADGPEGGVGVDTDGAGREGGGVGNKKDDSNDHGNSATVGDPNASVGKKSDNVDIYKEYLRDQNWTQSETDALLNLCHIHELRWPIIMDRWMSQFGPFSGKKVEDLQHRYYTIGTILNRRKVLKAVQVEAENLAKALAVAQSGANNTAPGSLGVGGDGVKNNIAGSLSSNALDSQLKEKLVAQHALAHSMAISTSAAVSTMVGDVKASILPPIPSINTGTSNQPTFDLQNERQRRRILEMIWLRSKEEELEEAELVKELKAIDTQIRRLKKSGGHILAAATATSSSTTCTNANNSQPLGINNNTAGSTPASSRGASPVPPPSFGVMAVGKDATDSSYSMLHAQFSSTAPTPTPGTPYLQSGRLVQPATGGHLSINKTTLKRMQQVLKELNVMERPIPTKRVCDMYDHVRKGALTLLTLQKVMLKKEGEVVSRRVKLEKIAGNAVAREAANAAAAAAAASVVTTAVLGSSPPTSALNIKGKGGSAAAGGGTGGVATTPKSSGGGSKKTGGGKGKGSKKKAGDGSKGGTKRKSSSKKAAAAAAAFTNNAGVSNSGGLASVVSISGSITPLPAAVLGKPGIVASSAQIHASSKALKSGDVGDTGSKQNKKRARKS